MKKQKKQLLILLILCVIAAGGGFGVLKYLEFQEQKAIEEAEAKAIYITKLEVEDITEFTLMYFGEERPFQKKDGVWHAMNKPEAEIQQEIVNNMAASLAAVIAEQKIENVKNLADFGLDAPGRSVEFTVGGRTYYIGIGDYNSLTECYYVYEGSDKTVVYLLEPGVMTGFFSVSDAQSLVEMNS